MSIVPEERVELSIEEPFGTNKIYQSAHNALFEKSNFKTTATKKHKRPCINTCSHSHSSSTSFVNISCAVNAITTPELRNCRSQASGILSSSCRARSDSPASWCWSNQFAEGNMPSSTKSYRIYCTKHVWFISKLKVHFPRLTSRPAHMHWWRHWRHAHLHESLHVPSSVKFMESWDLFGVP